MGVLGWPPREFWNATLAEFNAAVEGWNIKNGGGAPDAMTGDELAEMMKEYPDG